MNTALVGIKDPVQAPAATGKRTRAVSRAPAPSERPRLRTLLAMPIATLIAMAVHLLVSKNEPAIDTRSYSVFLGTLFGATLLAILGQSFWAGLRRWLAHMSPILAAVVLLLCVWELITSGFRLLPLPYFPSPAGVLQSLSHYRPR